MLRVPASSEPIEGLFPAFLHRYAARYPAVQLRLVEADAAEQLTMLERGELHLSVNVINIVQLDTHRFESYLLPHFYVLAACAASRGIAAAETVEICELVEHPLLLPKPGFATRILFDAACRLAAVRPNIFVESVSSHALVALAEAEHGVAVVPSHHAARTQGLASQAGDP